MLRSALRDGRFAAAFRVRRVSKHARRLRMRNFLTATEHFPHAEERLTGASRSMYSRDAADFPAPAGAGVMRHTESVGGFGSEDA